MRGRDGITMVRRIRANPGLRRVPVIFFTGEMAASDFIAGRSAAPFAYLSKRSAPGVLVEKVRHALGY
jgi:CheY-like chemotaxis protein